MFSGYPTWPFLGGVRYHVTYHMTHLMLPSTPSPWTDRHLWKHYLPATSFVGRNNSCDCPVYKERECSNFFSLQVRPKSYDQRYTRWIHTRNTNERKFHLRQNGLRHHQVLINVQFWVHARKWPLREIGNSSGWRFLLRPVFAGRGGPH